MQTIQQPAIKGYRQLSEADVALMNEAKALGEQIGAFIEKLRELPATHHNGTIIQDVLGRNSVSGRWISIGETHLQQGIMALVRAVAQPTTF